MLLKYRNQKGIGLIETLLALGVGIIVITSMVSLAVFTLRASLQNQLQLEGTQLANQQIELIRAKRDSQAWDEFVDDVDGTTGPNCFSPYMCYMSGVNVFGGVQTTGTGPKAITKSFTLTDESGTQQELIRVAVSVSWQIGGETKTTKNYTELSNWRQR